MGKTQILIQTKKPETNCMKFRLIYQLSSKSERSLFAIIVSEKKIRSHLIRLFLVYKKTSKKCNYAIKL